MIAAANTTPVSVRSPVDSSARKVMVSGPPMMPTAIDVMPTTAAMAGSMPDAGAISNISAAKILPSSAPSSSEAKNRPPRKPEPSEITEAAILSRKTEAMTVSP